MKFHYSYYDEKGNRLSVKKKSFFSFLQNGFTAPFVSHRFSYSDVGYLAAEGLQPCAKNRKWGYIDKNEKFVIQPIYDWVGYFKNDCAEVILESKRIKIDRKGNIVS